MGFISDIFSGNKGTGFEAQGANIVNPATPEQVTQQYGNAASAIDQQQQFVNALFAQNGTGNQNTGMQMLLNQAQGTGPNPALAQLNQATANNTANQAALMAGQRGSSANPALMARLAAQQGSANQQNAVGQAATLQAQQQAQAQQQYANQAAQQVAQQGQGVAGLNQAAQGLYGQVSGNVNQQNSAAIQNASQQNSANAAINSQIAQGQMGMAGGLLNAGGAALGVMKPMAQGGVVPGKAAMPGDHPANDTVAAKLSPGEVVIPKSIMESSDPASAAAAFVQGVMHSKKKVNNDQAYFSGGQVADNQDTEGSGDPMTMQQEDLPPPTIGINPEQAMLRNAATRAGATVPEYGMMQQEGIVPDMLKPAKAPGREFVPAVNGQSAANSPMADEAKVGIQPQADNGVDKYMQGINAEASAQGKLGNMQADILKKQQMDAESLMRNYQEQSSALGAKRAALIEDINANKINPNRYTENMSTGAKAATAIGFLLSGIGSGLAGQQNMAIQYLHKQIDSDIDAQKANLSSKNNLLAQNLQEYGNLKDAVSATKVMQADIYANQLQQAAAKMADPIAKAKAMQEAAKIQMQYAPQADRLAKSQALNAAIAKGVDVPLAEVARSVVDEKDRDNVMKELATYENVQKNKADLRAAMEKVGELQKTENRVLKPVQSLKQINALNVNMDAALKPIFGALSESDKVTANEAKIHFMDDEETKAAKIQSIINLIDKGAATPTLDSYPALRTLKNKQQSNITGGTPAQNPNAPKNYKGK